MRLQEGKEMEASEAKVQPLKRREERRACSESLRCVALSSSLGLGEGVNGAWG